MEKNKFEYILNKHFLIAAYDHNKYNRNITRDICRQKSFVFSLFFSRARHP